MVPTDEAIITRQMLYSARFVPATCAAIAITASIDPRPACQTVPLECHCRTCCKLAAHFTCFRAPGKDVLLCAIFTTRLARINRKFRRRPAFAGGVLRGTDDGERSMEHKESGRQLPDRDLDAVAIQTLAERCLAALDFTAREVISAKAGTDSGIVRCCSGTGDPLRIASVSISRARSVFGRIKIVAASSPLRTQAWPVLGMPSQPVKGIFSQRSRSPRASSANAFLAPIAMLSSCAPTSAMCISCEVRRRSHELTAR